MNRQKNSTILLVDDEQNILTVLSSVLRQEGYTVLLAASAEESLERLHSASVDLVVTDLRLPGKSGLELLEELTSIQPGLPVIMITAFGSIENAVQAMKLGAFNYLTKPVNTDEFLLLIRKALDTSSLQAENLDLKKALKDNYRLGSMIGKSRAMQEVFTLVAKVNRPAVQYSGHRRDRDRQRACRQGHSLFRSIRQPAFCDHRLRLRARIPAGIRALRSCQGRFHRGGPDPEGTH